MTSWFGTAFGATGPFWGEPPVTSGFPLRGPVMGALMFFLVLALTNCWTNSQIVGDWCCHHACFHHCNILKLKRQQSLTKANDNTVLWYICIYICISNGLCLSTLPQRVLNTHMRGWLLLLLLLFFYYYCYYHYYYHYYYYYYYYIPLGLQWKHWSIYNGIKFFINWICFITFSEISSVILIQCGATIMQLIFLKILLKDTP